jgi:uncharacterized protein (DUF2141 family)
MLLASAGCGAEKRVTLAPLPASGGDVRFEVVATGLRGTRGMVRGALFASASGFPDEHERAVRRAEAPAREGALLVFEHVPQGDYALAVLHDEDGDGRLARNLLGIPREGYALSGAPVGLPRFDSAVIRLTPPLCRVELRMKYWGQ